MRIKVEQINCRQETAESCTVFFVCFVFTILFTLFRIEFFQYPDAGVYF